MKKRFVKVCAMALAIGMAFTSVSYTARAEEATTVSSGDAGDSTVSGGDVTESQMLAPGNLTVDTTSGSFQYSFDIPENGMSGTYAIMLFKDDVRLEYQSRSNCQAGTTVYHDQVQHFNESGTYTVKVAYRYRDESGAYAFGEWAETSVEYTRPQNEVAQPTLTWSEESVGVLNFQLAENARGYLSRLYYYDEYNDRYVQKAYVVSLSGLADGENVSVDYSQYMTESGQYHVEMYFVSKDITTIANSQTSKSAVYSTEVAESEVNDAVDSVVEQSKTDATGAVATLVNQTDVSELRVAMQTNEEVRGKIATLEQNYMAQTGVTVEKTLADDVKSVMPSDALNNIKVVGAALNINKANTAVALDVAMATNKVDVGSNGFSDSVQLDIKLVSEGAEMHGQLKVPVTITMPAPTGMDINHLTLLHYYADGSGSEVVSFVNNGDGTITFTVDRFSTFVFGETADDDDEDDDDDTTEATTLVKDNVPKTGDSLPIALPMAVTVAFGVAAIALKKKEI